MAQQSQFPNYAQFLLYEMNQRLAGIDACIRRPAQIMQMARKRFSAELIVVLLRQIEVLMSQGKAAPVECREAGIS